jgi:hypothetical protein
MSTEVLQSHASKPWELNVPKKDHFSGDEVIQAYFKGKEVGKADGLRAGSEATRRLILNALTENLAKAGTDTQTILRAFKSQRLPAEDALLRIDSWHKFSVLIVTSENAFMSQKLLKVYDAVNALETEEVNDQYCIRFSFVAGGKELDPKVVSADGYVLKLKPNIK